MPDYFPYRGCIMTTLAQLYAESARRANENNLPYAGAVLPAEAFELMQLDPTVRLVDVRTRAELDWVGRPAIDGAQYVHIEWIRYPGSVPNTEFLAQLREVAQADTPVLFLCRSAARSKLAAVMAQKNGFTQAYDLLEGFEGDKDAQGHRKTVSGWCFRGLPWIGA
jgi:rhodanese-related sulfurtransferase